MPIKIKKSTSKNNSNNFKALSITLGALVLAGGLWLIFRPKPSSINLITAPAPIPTSSPNTCNQQVSSLTFTESCGQGLYRYATNILCFGVSIPFKLGGTTSCKDMTTWHSEALSICKQKYCSSPVPSPIACRATILKYRETCGDPLTKSFRYVDYTCYTGDKIRTQGSTSSCKPTTVWSQNAQSDCARACLPTPTSTPIPTPKPSITPTPTPTPTIPSYCYPLSMSRWYTESCGTGTYRYVNYQCYETDKVRVIGSPTSCNTLAQWDEQVKVDCNKICPFPSNTPTPPRPSSSPK